MIALSLSSLALVSVCALTGAAMRAQVHAVKSTTAQMNADLAFRSIEREVSEATALFAPAQWGLTSGLLEACSNAESVPNAGPPMPIDGARSMRFFAFCSAGPTVYYHVLAGCPAAYACGRGAVASFGDAAHPVALRVRRPSSYSPVVEVSIDAAAAEASARRASSFAVASSAGSNQ